MSSVQPGQVAAGTFADNPVRTPLAFAGRVTIMLERAPQVGREGAPSATADSHTAPEVKKWLAHKDPAPLAFALHPDLQLMAQPDRALVQGTERQTAPPWRVHQCRRPHRGRSPSGPNTGTPTRSRSHGKPPRNRSSPKSDADIKVRRGRETLHRIKAQTDHYRLTHI